MKKFLKSKNIIIIAIVCVVILAVVITALADGGNGVLSKAVNTVTKPVQTGISAAVGWLENVYGYMYKYDQIENENTELKKQLTDMENVVREADTLREENERLRRLLDLSEKHTDFKFENATVMSRDSSNWNSYLTISKGSSSGLELNDVVVTELGYVVGQITELGENWATVRAVNDTQINIGAAIEGSGTTAVLTGDFTLMQDNCAKLSYVPAGTSLERGQKIFTSGNGGIYPQGLIIGEVEDVVYEDSGLSVYGIIKCSANISEVSQVFVITDYEITE